MVKNNFDTQVDSLPREYLWAFSDDGEYAANVTTDGRLKLWDVASGSLAHQYAEKDHLTIKYTSMSWVKPKAKKSGKKRQKALGLIALGASNGQITVRDLQSGETVQTLGGDKSHLTPVNDIAMNSRGTLLYSATSDKYVLEWDIKSGKVLRKFKVGKGGASKLALSPDGATLATGSNTIRLWDLSSGEKLSSMNSGHASVISILQYSRDGKLLVSSSKGSRFLNVYSTSSDPVRSVVLNVDFGPVAVDTYTLGTSTTLVVSVGDNGHTSVFSLDGNGKLDVKKSGLTAAGTIKLGDTDSSQSPEILCAAFGEGGSLSVARGSETKPFFEMLQACNEDGDVRKHIVVSRTDKNLLIRSDDHPDEKKAKIEAAQKPAAQAEFVASAKDKSHSSVQMQDDEDDTILAIEEDADSPEAGAGGKTLGERVAELTKQWEAESSDEETTQPSKAVIPHAGTLVSVLEQALQANDDSMLEYCLNTTDPKIIHSTIERLSAVKVLAFLTKVVDKFERKPARASVLSIWILAALTHHTGYLMTIPNLVQQLATLYHTIDSRVSGLSNFMKLSGRLDLVLAQISKRQSAEAGHSNSQPEKVFKDEAVSTDEEEEEDDQEEHEDSNEEDNTSDVASASASDSDE